MAHVSTLLLLVMTGGALACAGYLVFMLRKRMRRIEDKLDRLARFDMGMWDTWAWARLLPDIPDLPAPTGWSATPELIGELIRRIDLQQPALVVELGSGLSTLAIAQALKRRGHGRLVSIDHEGVYGGNTQALLQRAGLDDVAQVRIAALQSQTIGTQACDWYAAEAFDGLGLIDLLFVDGPPAAQNPAARTPTLQALWPRLRPGGLVVFDDADRPHERRCIDEWQRAHPGTRVEWLPLRKGCAVLHKPSADAA